MVKITLQVLCLKPPAVTPHNGHTAVIAMKTGRSRPTIHTESAAISAVLLLYQLCTNCSQRTFCTEVLNMWRLKLHRFVHLYTGENLCSSKYTFLHAPVLLSVGVCLYALYCRPTLANRVQASRSDWILIPALLNDMHVPSWYSRGFM